MVALDGHMFTWYVKSHKHVPLEVELPRIIGLEAKEKIPQPCRTVGPETSIPLGRAVFS